MSPVATHVASPASLLRECARKAPRGQYRVIGVDTFELLDPDYLIGDFSNLREARIEAAKHARDLNPVFIYDDQGTCLWSRSG